MDTVTQLILAGAVIKSAARGDQFLKAMRSVAQRPNSEVSLNAWSNLAPNRRVSQQMNVSSDGIKWPNPLMRSSNEMSNLMREFQDAGKTMNDGNSLASIDGAGPMFAAVRGNLQLFQKHNQALQESLNGIFGGSHVDYLGSPAHDTAMTSTRDQAARYLRMMRAGLKPAKF